VSGFALNTCPSCNNLPAMLSLSEIPKYTGQWIALKHNSRFSMPCDISKNSATPYARGFLHVDDPLSMLSMMIEDEGVVSTVFIRECYMKWFEMFRRVVEKKPTAKFGVSSSPGCGKTFFTNLFLKMAASVPELQNKPILYQFKSSFFYFDSDKVFLIRFDEALKIALLPETFYILDGLNAEPLKSDCLTLFIASPRNNAFQDWNRHAKIVPCYFPVWTLDELRECRTICYPDISKETVDLRYERYGGIARYVFWPQDEEPPSIEGVVADRDARQSLRFINEPSQLFPSSHILLHIAIDANMHFQHVFLASRYIGKLLFSKFFKETFARMQELLGSGGALAGHLFECYVHFLFEHGQEEPLKCRSLEGLQCGSVASTRSDAFPTRWR
jgi:hypothetical protein